MKNYFKWLIGCLLMFSLSFMTFAVDLSPHKIKNRSIEKQIALHYVNDILVTPDIVICFDGVNLELENTNKITQITCITHSLFYDSYCFDIPVDVGKLCYKPYVASKIKNSSIHLHMKQKLLKSIYLLC